MANGAMVKNHVMGVLFMNPSRRSAMVFTLAHTSLQTLLQTSSRRLDEMRWEPDVYKVQEFTLCQQEGEGITRCSDVDQIQRCLYKMGFGPCPFFRRPGVLIYCCPEAMHEDDRYMGTGKERKKIGCIVPHHEAHQHMCKTCRLQKCYLCIHNPFYEVAFGGKSVGIEEEYDGEGRRISDRDWDDSDTGGSAGSFMKTVKIGRAHV